MSGSGGRFPKPKKVEKREDIEKGGTILGNESILLACRIQWLIRQFLIVIC